jgi:UDP-N-acetylmuramate--alanine ligase
MHIYFSGIGGTGIGPLALIASQAGYGVSGSDKQDSGYVHYLRENGLSDIHIGQAVQQIAEVHARKPIDWLVHTSALTIEHPDAPELEFCRQHDIKFSKRDEFLSYFLKDNNLKLIAIAGTHGKTTTTAMMIWLLKQLGIPLSYSVGAKISFGDMGHYDPKSEYFVYEADEYDHNFLSFQPHLSLITGIDWDHADIYPTRDNYYDAFRQFLGQSQQAVLWRADVERLGLSASQSQLILDEADPAINKNLSLPGQVNREDAWQVANASASLLGLPLEKLLPELAKFPGVARRFEQIAPNLYSDYAHTPPKIRGALQLAQETAGASVVVVYEGLHNTRQHFIKTELANLFDDVKQLLIVPSYLAREDPTLALLAPEDLRQLLSPSARAKASAAQLDASLQQTITDYLANGNLVLCLTAGGGGSLDEWLRHTFQP